MSPSPSRIVRPLERGVRAKRLEQIGGLVVESKTLGTSMSYLMGTDNLSRTGLLLNLGRNKRVPFQVNTLLELTVDPAGSMFDRPLACVGKIVRLDASEPDAGVRYGVHIVQMEGRDLDAWEAHVTQLEIQQDFTLPAA